MLCCVTIRCSVTSGTDYLLLTTPSLRSPTLISWGGEGGGRFVFLLCCLASPMSQVMRLFAGRRLRKPSPTVVPLASESGRKSAYKESYKRFIQRRNGRGVGGRVKGCRPRTFACPLHVNPRSTLRLFVLDLCCILLLMPLGISPSRLLHIAVTASETSISRFNREIHMRP